MITKQIQYQELDVNNIYPREFPFGNILKLQPLFLFWQNLAFTALKMTHTHTKHETLRQRRLKSSYGSKWETLHFSRDVQFQYPGF